MDHVVYLDTSAKELAHLLSGEKTMIIRGAAGRKLPYGQVNYGDMLFFINNNAEGLIRAKARVKSVTNSGKMDEEASKALVKLNQSMLQLTKKQEERWAGKRYLVLIEVEGVEQVEPFCIDKSGYENMDDWLTVGTIDSIKGVSS
jgi:hypothetical protein